MVLRRLGQFGLPALLMAMLVAAVVIFAFAPMRNSPAAASRICTNTLGVKSDPDHPADTESLAIARDALHRVSFQTLGTAAAYRQEEHAVIFEADGGGTVNSLDPNSVPWRAAHQFLVTVIVMDKLQKLGIDTDGMVVTGNYTCSR